jgi:hypothetical protein
MFLANQHRIAGTNKFYRRASATLAHKPGFSKKPGFSVLSSHPRLIPLPTPAELFINNPLRSLKFKIALI